GTIDSFKALWIPTLGATISFTATNMAVLLTLLSAIVYSIIYIFQWNKPVSEENRFYALMQLSQAGIIGVFLASDVLLFYFFWELALIPVYFLCSQWGG